MDCGADIAKLLERHQTVDVVLPGESGNQLVLVLEHPPLEIVSYPCVQAAKFTSHDVNEVSLHCDLYSQSRTTFSIANTFSHTVMLSAAKHPGSFSFRDELKMQGLSAD